jgi:D-alanyl-D-alanine carboxypeptidase (penicillin-binding protein 5/6)
MKNFLAALLAMACAAHAAESYIIIDNQTGKVLESRKAREKLPVASLTKVATALVVLDWASLNNADLSQTVDIPPVALVDSSVNPIGFLAGDRLSLRDLVYCALLASDNISARTLAHHIGSRIPNPSGLQPIENFVAQLNALARTLGMQRTLFLNPSGFDSIDRGKIPHSTAEDMARLARHAQNDAGFAFYVAQRTRQIHIHRGGQDFPYEIKNTNDLLGREGIDGVKTGRTRRAGDCLIVSSERPPESRREGETVLVTPRRITVVLLRSPDRFADGLGLIRHGWGLYDQWAAEGRPVKKDTL